MQYLKAFVIGSSFITTLPFFITVMNIPNTIKNYSYNSYTIIAPLYFGIMNMIAIYLSSILTISLRQIYFIMSLVSAAIVITVVHTMNLYHFTPQQWIPYYIRVIIRHMIAYNIFIYYLNIYVQ